MKTGTVFEKITSALLRPWRESKDRVGMLTVSIAIMLPPLLGYVFGAAWVGIVSCFVVLLSYLLIRRWTRRNGAA